MVKDSDLACDITQDVFVQVIKDIGSLREPELFAGWLKTITANQCNRYFRKKKDVLVEENEDGSSIFDIQQEEREEFLPDAVVDRADFRKTVMSLIDQLPDAQRMAVVMHYYQGLSIKDIAQIQEVKENTVKTRLYHAREAIRKLVLTYEQENDIKLYNETEQPSGQPMLPWVFQGDTQPMPQEAAARVAAGITAATHKPIQAQVPAQQPAKTGRGIWEKLILTIVAVALLIGCVALLIFALSGKDPEPLPEATEAQTPAESTAPSETNAQTTPPTETTLGKPDYEVVTELTIKEPHKLAYAAARSSLLWAEPILVSDVSQLTAEEALRMTAINWADYDTDTKTVKCLALAGDTFDELCMAVFGRTYDPATMSGKYATYDAAYDVLKLNEDVDWLWDAGYAETGFYEDTDGSYNFAITLYESSAQDARELGTYTLTMEPNAAQDAWVLRSIVEGKHLKGTPWVNPTEGEWDFVPSGAGELRSDGIYYAKTTDQNGNTVYRYIRVLDGLKLISQTSAELELPGPDWDADDVNWLDLNSKVDQGSLMWWGMGDNRILKGSLLLKSGGHYFMQVEPYGDGMLVHYTYEWEKQDSPDQILGYQFVPFA